jgi:hypothetical protein
VCYLGALNPSHFTPLKSTVSVSNLVTTISSHVFEKKQEIYEKVRRNLKSCSELKIKLYFGAETDPVISDTVTSDISTALESLPTISTDVLCNIMEIQSDCPQNVNFYMDDLRSTSEPDFQNKYVTPLAAAESHICDTHKSNEIAKALCVSPAYEGKVFFRSKPDLLSALLPMVVEIKSRVAKSAPTAAAGTPSASMRNLNLESEPSRGCITLVECDLFQQCVGRILEQAQFRAYLSKFVVLASTGHTSWCFFYTQSVEKCSFEKQLRVLRISNSDVNIVWNGMTAAVENRGDAFFLTKHGRVLANTVQSLFPTLDIHSIRVNVASTSQSVVYYVTAPFSLLDGVHITEKRYALKIVADVTSFRREILALNRVKAVWEERGPNQTFYYLMNSDEHLFCVSSPKKIYSWFVSREAAASEMKYGVIVMLPAYRTPLTTTEDVDGRIFAKLLESLSVAHKAGVLHCDLSPRNCLRFPGDCWQVVDYGLSCEITQHNGWFTSHSGKVLVQKGSYQHKCCGWTASNIIEEDEELEVEIDWTIGFDLEMLQRACRRK